jgi:hypothetical protein
MSNFFLNHPCNNIEISPSLRPRCSFYRLILLGFFLLFVPSIHAQGTDLRGIVSDSTTGERIPYANVFIKSLNIGNATNMNGFYLIPNIPAGSCEIAVSALGYTTKRRTVIVRRGEPITVNFQLRLQPIEMSEVVVEGRAKRELAEINTSVHILDPQEIQRIPVPVQNDLLRAIQILPGIVSTADVSAKFYVRGGGGDQNLILLDGMKIYNPFHAFGLFSVFDPDLVKAAEVYTAAFPPGFGGRLSSVVNVSTRSGNSKEIAGKANINLLSSKIQMEGPLWEKSMWILSARKSLFNSTYKYFLQNPVPISFYDAYFKTTIETEGYARHSLFGFLSGDDVTSDKQDEPEYHWRSQALGVNITSLIADRLYLDILLYNSSFTAERDPKKSTVVRPAFSKVSETSMRANITAYSESKDLYSFGFELNLPEFDNTFTNNSNQSRSITSANAESWVWIRYQTSIDKWKFDGGIHTDMFRLLDGNFTLGAAQPRLNISYEFVPFWRVKASYGVFSQNIITLNNEDDVIPLFESWTYIPDYLKPEEADHYVLGIEGPVTSLLTTTVQIYYKSYRSLVLYNRAKFYPADPDFLNGTGRAAGFETLLRFSMNQLEFYTSYTLGWTIVDANGFSYNPRYDRRHTVNILSVYKPAEEWEISLRWEFGSGFPFSPTVGYYDRLSLRDPGGDPFSTDTGTPYSILGEKNSSRLPAYHRLDGSVNYRLQFSGATGSLGLHLVNIYNRNNILFFDRKSGQHINMLPFFPSVSATIEF